MASMPLLLLLLLQLQLLLQLLLLLLLLLLMLLFGRENITWKVVNYRGTIKLYNDEMMMQARRMYIVPRREEEKV